MKKKKDRVKLAQQPYGIPQAKQYIQLKVFQKEDERKKRVENLFKDTMAITNLTWGKKQIFRFRKSKKYQTK